MTAVHLVALDLLCVLDRDLSLREIHEDDEHEDEQHDDEECDNEPHVLRDVAVADVFESTDEGLTRRSEDAHEDDEGRTVADAVFGDPVADPHDEAATAYEHDDDERHRKRGGPEGRVKHVFAPAEADTDALDDREHDRHIARDLRDLLPAVLTLLGKPVEGRDNERQKLHDNECVDKWNDTQCEQCPVLERSARDRGHYAEEVVRCEALEAARCDARHGDETSQPEDQQHQER